MRAMVKAHAQIFGNTADAVRMVKTNNEQPAEHHGGYGAYPVPMVGAHSIFRPVADVPHDFERTRDWPT